MPVLSIVVALRNPKSAILHVPVLETSMFRVAKSCSGEILTTGLDKVDYNACLATTQHS